MRPRVLLYGRARDPHTLALSRELRRQGLSVSSLDPDDYPRRQSIDLSLSAAGLLKLSPAVVMRADVGWLGASRTASLSPSIAPMARPFARESAHQTLESFIRACPFPWVNNYTSAVAADDKFNQLVVAHSLGFRVPATLVTNDPGAFQRFQRKHRLIAKSISGSRGLPDTKRIMTNEVVPEDRARAKKVALAPVLFQEQLAKKSELRVTVVGEEAFAIRIHSQEHARTRVDWRRYVPGMRYSIAKLPQTEITRCLDITKALGLDYSGIDIVETPSGELIFLEINSLPAWIWIEEETKAPITQALARYLRVRALNG